jgi:hypothetical protein
MDAVAAHVCLLADIVAIEDWIKSVKVEDMGPSPEFQQQAADATQQCLKGIGAHIEGGTWPPWVSGIVSAPLLWQFVADATQLYHMKGPQLGRLYTGLKRRHGWQLPAAGGCVILICIYRLTGRKHRVLFDGGV